MPFEVNVHLKVAVYPTISAADVAAAEAKVARVKDELSRQRDLEPKSHVEHSETPFVAAYGPYSGGNDSIEGITKAMLAQESKKATA